MRAKNVINIIGGCQREINFVTGNRKWVGSATTVSRKDCVPLSINKCSSSKKTMRLFPHYDDTSWPNHLNARYYKSLEVPFSKEIVSKNAT